VVRIPLPKERKFPTSPSRDSPFFPLPTMKRLDPYFEFFLFSPLLFSSGKRSELGEDPLPLFFPLSS